MDNPQGACFWHYMEAVKLNGRKQMYRLYQFELLGGLSEKAPKEEVYSEISKALAKATRSTEPLHGEKVFLNPVLDERGFPVQSTQFLLISRNFTNTDFAVWDFSKNQNESRRLVYLHLGNEWIMEDMYYSQKVWRPVPTSSTILSEIIRGVDWNKEMGERALADAILYHPEFSNFLKALEKNS